MYIYRSDIICYLNGIIEKDSARTAEEDFCDSELQLCLFPGGIFTNEFVDPYGERFSLSSLMFSLFFDLWIAANSSSLDIVLFVGDSIKLVGVLLPDDVWTGVLLPEFGIDDEQLLLALKAKRSATVGILRPVGVDDLKLLP